MTNARPTAAPADRPWLTAGLLGLLTFLVFLPAVRCGFVDWDDDVYVTDNPLVLGGLTAEGVRGAFTSVVFHNWAPLTILSYQLDTTLFGRDPWGFHLTNVVIHAVSAGLLASVLLRMTGRMAASLLAATLFAIHPLRVESVVWISERKDVLCVLFLMLALLAYDRYTRNPGGLRYLAVAAAMLAGLLAKSTLVTLPLLLLILDAWPLGRVRGLAADGAAASRPARPLWWLVAEKIPLLCLSLLFSRTGGTCFHWSPTIPSPSDGRRRPWPRRESSRRRSGSTCDRCGRRSIPGRSSVLRGSTKRRETCRGRPATGSGPAG